MIASLAKMSLLGMVAILAGWGWALARANRGEVSPGEFGFEELPGAVHSSEVRADFLLCATRTADGAAGLLPRALGPGIARRFRLSAALLGLHAALTWEVLPVLGAAILSAGALGLARREALRQGQGFASPIQAYAAKQCFLLAAFLLLAFSLTPAPLPLWTPWLAGAGMAGGGILYLANMPIKL